MQSVGIDFCLDYCVVAAVCRAGNMIALADTVYDDIESPLFPTLVGFDGSRRLFANSAKILAAENVISLNSSLVLAAREKKAEDIHWVEIFGSCAGEETFNSLVLLFSKRKCRRSMHQMHSVAKGCALRCWQKNFVEAEVEIDEDMQNFRSEESRMVSLDRVQETILQKEEMNKLLDSISKYEDKLDSNKQDEKQFLIDMKKWPKAPNSDLSSVGLRRKAKALDRGFSKLSLKRSIFCYKDSLKCLKNQTPKDLKFVKELDVVLKELGKPDDELDDEKVCSPAYLSEWKEKLNSMSNSLWERIRNPAPDDKQSKPKVAELPPKLPKLLSLTETIDHEITICYDSGFATGHASWNNFVIPTCYFKAFDPKRLLTICSGHTNLVSLLGFVSQNEAGFNIATEKVENYLDFFRKEWNAVLTDYTSKKDLDGCPTIFQMWWDAIESKFQIFFRGVIEAVLYMHDHKVVICSNCIYINSYGHARVLPCGLAPENKAINHIIVVKEAMVKVLTLPFDATVDKFVCKLPVELQGFFGRKHNNTLMECLCESILLYEAYFWTIDERVQFMNKMIDALKSIDTFKNYWDVDHQDITWVDDVSLFEGGRFTAELDDWRIRSHFKSFGEVFPSDIIRFINALFSHKNDKPKDQKTNNRYIYEVYELEGLISGMFTGVYSLSMEVIYGALTTGLLKMNEHKVERLHDGLYCPGGMLRPSKAKSKFSISIPNGQTGFKLD